jgi:tetratricopeptide (TPR) repeat protein
MRRAPSPALATAGVAIAVAACAWLPERDARAPRLEGYGSLTFEVTTRDAEARDLFTRGLLQTYAFNGEEARRAFKASLARDPDCALCAWGVALTLGPNINAIERGDLAEARRYAAWAQGHAAAATPRERALIDALVARYGSPDGRSRAEPPAAPVCGSGATKPPDPLDVAYAERLRAAVDAWPDDPDVASLYAEALLIAVRSEPWDRATGAPAPGIPELAARLERLLARHPDHTGLNHYLIHVVDASPAPQRAEAAADRLGRLAPASPHLLHMPSHIYIRLGRYADAARVNVEGLDADVRRAQQIEAQGFTKSPSWEGHNRHFLWFALLMEGRGDGALEEARLFAKRAETWENAGGDWMRALPVFTLARLERWSDVLAEPLPRSTSGFGTAVAHQARGLALLHLGRTAEAEGEAAALRAAVESPALAGQKVWDTDSVRDILAVLSGRLEGELAVARGRPDEARAALEAAVKQEAGLELNEPPLLAAGARLALGDALVQARRWSEAEAAYRADLAAWPESGWALRGLDRALAGQGRAQEAARTRDALARAWPTADATLVKGGS